MPTKCRLRPHHGSEAPVDAKTMVHTPTAMERGRRGQDPLSSRGVRGTGPKAAAAPEATPTCQVGGPAGYDRGLPMAGPPHQPVRLHLNRGPLTGAKSQLASKAPKAHSVILSDASPGHPLMAPQSQASRAPICRTPGALPCFGTQPLTRASAHNWDYRAWKTQGVK